MRARTTHPHLQAAVTVCVLSACATTPSTPRCDDRSILCRLNEPSLETKNRAVRCTADTSVLCLKHVVRLDETDCRAHVLSIDLCSGRTTESVFTVPFCAQHLDAFVAKQTTERTVPCLIFDGTRWIEEVADAHEVRVRSVCPDETANIGLACLELFQLSRTALLLPTNAVEAR